MGGVVAQGDYCCATQRSDIANWGHCDVGPCEPEWEAWGAWLPCSVSCAAPDDPGAQSTSPCHRVKEGSCDWGRVRTRACSEVSSQLGLTCEAEGGPGFMEERASCEPPPPPC